MCKPNPDAGIATTYVTRRPGELNNNARWKYVHAIRFHGLYTIQWGALHDKDSVGILDTLSRQRDNTGSQHENQCLYKEPFLPIAQFYKSPEVTVHGISRAGNVTGGGWGGGGGWWRAA